MMTIMRTLTLVFAAAVCGHFLLQLFGFCYAYGGVKSDNQLIRDALTLESYRPDVDPILVDSFRSGDYISGNIGCCEVNRWSDPLMPNVAISSLLGSRMYVVSFVYPDTASDLKVYNKVHYILTTCGQKMERISITTKEKSVT